MRSVMIRTVHRLGTGARKQKFPARAGPAADRLVGEEVEEDARGDVPAQRGALVVHPRLPAAAERPRAAAVTRAPGERGRGAGGHRSVVVGRAYFWK